MARGTERLPFYRMLPGALVAGAIGFAGAVACYCHFLQVVARTPLARWTVILGMTLAFGALAWATLCRWMLPRMAVFSLRIRIAWATISLLVGALLLVAIPVPTAPPAPLRHTLESLIFSCVAISLACMFALASGWLITRPDPPARAVHVGRWTWLGYASFCAAYWGWHLWICWPGLMSMDSVTQWCQILNGQPEDVMPICHTYTVWLLLLVWRSPAVVATAQIVGLSAVAGWMLSRWNGWGMPKGASWLACACFALMPATGNLVITLWKDIPYTIAVLALTQCVLEAVVSNGAWLRRKRHVAIVLCAALVVALFRHNGPPVAFGTLILLALCYRSYWRGLAVAWLVLAVVWLGVKYPLPPMLGIPRVPEYLVLAPVIHHLAAHTAVGDTMTEDEKSLLAEIHPLDHGQWTYDPYNICGLFYDGRFNFAQVHQRRAELVRLYLSLWLRQPSVNLKHIAKSTAYLWRITQPRNSLYDSGAPYYWGGMLVKVDLARVDPQHPREELVQVGPAPRLRPLGMLSYRDPRYNWLFCRPALYMYLFFFAVATAAFRSGCWRYLLVAGPVAIQTLFLIPYSMTSEFRYQWGVFLLGLLMSLLLLAYAPKPRKPA